MQIAAISSIFLSTARRCHYAADAAADGFIAAATPLLPPLRRDYFFRCRR
jgi:hypothetical protein